MRIEINKAYDDLDDPKSPKYGSRTVPVRTTVIWHLRRSRKVILGTLVLLSFICYLSSRRRPFFRPQHAPSLRFKSVDWSRYAYSQYATNRAYLCNSVMVFEALERLGSKADRILLYNQEWDLDIANKSDRDSQLLVKASNWYGVKLVPIEVQKFEAEKGWSLNIC